MEHLIKIPCVIFNFLRYHFFSKNKEMQMNMFWKCFVVPPSIANLRRTNHTNMKNGPKNRTEKPQQKRKSTQERKK